MTKKIALLLAALLLLCSCGKKTGTAIDDGSRKVSLEDVEELRRIVSCTYFSYIWNSTEDDPGHGAIELISDSQKAAFVVFYLTYRGNVNELPDGSTQLPTDRATSILEQKLGLQFSDEFLQNSGTQARLTSDYYGRDWDSIAYLDFFAQEDTDVFITGILCEIGNFGLGLPRDFEASFQYINGSLQLLKLNVDYTSQELSESF